MFPSSPRASVSRRLLDVLVLPWTGVVVGFTVFAFASSLWAANLVHDNVGPRLGVSSTLVTTPLVSVSPKAVVKDGMADVTLTLNKVQDHAVKVSTVVAGTRQTVAIPAGQLTTSVSVPLGA